MDPVSKRETLDSFERLTQWELFRNVLPELTSLNMQMHSPTESDKAAPRYNCRPHVCNGWPRSFPAA